MTDFDEKLRQMATAEDGVLEAVYAPESSFVMAVQWHPEFSFRTDAASRKIFAAFARACQASANRPNP